MNPKDYIKKYLPEDQWERAWKELEENRPVQYIVGNIDFYGNILYVDESVLIPRFETEELVEKTIKYVKKYLKEPISFVDLGCGSGCIAITLKKMLNGKATAVDMEEKALEIAKKNAHYHHVDITFLKGDMLKPLKECYDLIISNPPYLDEEEPIMDIVKKNEPHKALFAPNHGIFYYEQILSQVRPYLNKKAIIAFEIGENQKEALLSLGYRYFKEESFWVEKDMQGRDRFFFLMYGFDKNLV